MARRRTSSLQMLCPVERKVAVVVVGPSHHNSVVHGMLTDQLPADAQLMIKQTCRTELSVFCIGTHQMHSSRVDLTIVDCAPACRSEPHMHSQQGCCCLVQAPAQKAKAPGGSMLTCHNTAYRAHKLQLAKGPCLDKPSTSRPTATALCGCNSISESLLCESIVFRADAGGSLGLRLVRHSHHTVGFCLLVHSICQVLSWLDDCNVPRWDLPKSSGATLQQGQRMQVKRDSRRAACASWAAAEVLCWLGSCPIPTQC